MSDLEAAFHRRWLGMVEPIDGLVLSVPVLTEAQCMERQPPELGRRVAADDGGLTMPLPSAKDGRARRTIPDLGRFLAEVLALQPALFDKGEALPADLSLYVPEGKETLRPSMALKHKGPLPAMVDDASSSAAARAGAGYRMLVSDLPGVSLDAPDTREGTWRYPPAAKFDRLLRACRVPLGLLTNREEFRLIYAPHGESSGAITFRVGDMASPGGKEILDAFVMLLSAQRFFGVAPERQLPELCRRSRLYQANVTTELAEQVLDALAALLTGFEAAERRDGTGTLREAYDRGGDHLYGGLLTVLLRLVFVLYAEDADLLPVEHPHYAQHLGVLGLFDRLQRDRAAFPDTMARRFGAWPRLCALFRAVYFGVERRADPSIPGFVTPLRLPPRRGQLFDPEAYPFLEGWHGVGGAPVADDDRAAVRVPTVDDETVHRVLERLVLHRGQRLSYRALDVEQIGSVYEALMGYHVLRLPAAALCLRPSRVWAVAAELLDLPPARRAPWLEDEAAVPKNQLAKIAKALEAATTEQALFDALAPLAVKGDARAGAERYVIQPGAERRRTSSHYTPRSLSAPIVARTLEPLLLAMGDEPSSEQILDVKVCDPAMGSGAFLVEACRWLGDRVVGAWSREGAVSMGEEPTLRARRLVAQRCLYGVDKNLFAVNLAKLSLWLVTLAKDEPFTFVDHALRHGDSLVGLSFDQIRAFHWAEEAQMDLFDKELREALDEALLMRQRILELAKEDGKIKTEEKERLLSEAEDAMDRIRLLGDLVVGAFFAKERDKDRKAERLRRMDLVKQWLGSGEPVPEELRAMQAEIRERIPVFHWMVEFPEVFWSGRKDPLEGGAVNKAAYMDAFVGNPPFAGKNSISDANGPAYIEWMMALHADLVGRPNTDLCAYFFRRCAELIGTHGALGLIATNTIAQGDSRLMSLKALVDGGAIIYDAQRSFPWPGAASVSVAIAHLAFGRIAQTIQSRTLDGKRVTTINSRLDPRPERADPVRLSSNANLSFMGGKLVGAGLAVSLDEYATLVAADPANAQVLRPYLGGEEVNRRPDGGHERYMIDFTTRSLEEARQWPLLMRIIEEKVRPTREKDNRGTYKTYWWRPGESGPALYAALNGLERCLVTSRVTKHLSFSFQPTSTFFAETLYVFALYQLSAFALLQSRVHETWARLLSSSLEDRLRYAGSDCFDPFPFPAPDPRAPLPALESIGERLYTARADYMKANNVGLTITYNRLKDPENTEPAIVALRALHEEMDRAVLAAYGWSDIVVPPYGTPVTDAEKAAVERFEDEVIDRLFALNAERAAEEKMRGATAGAKQAKPSKQAKPKGAGKAAKTTPAKQGKTQTKNAPGEQLGLLGPEGDDDDDRA